jgi:hypothetical protein
MPKFRNIWVHDVDVPVSGFMRTVKSGDVIDVPDDEAEGLASQVGVPDSHWESADQTAAVPELAPEVPAAPAV